MENFYFLNYSVTVKFFILISTGNKFKIILPIFVYCGLDIKIVKK